MYIVQSTDVHCSTHYTVLSLFLYITVHSVQYFVKIYIEAQYEQYLVEIYIAGKNVLFIIKIYSKVQNVHTLHSRYVLCSIRNLVDILCKLQHTVQYIVPSRGYIAVLLFLPVV